MPEPAPISAVHRPPRGAIKWVLVGIGALIVAIGLAVSLPRWLHGGAGSGPLVALVGAVILGVVVLVIAFSLGGLGKSLTSVSVDSTGVRLNYDPPGQRLLPWSQARTWLELIDVRPWNAKNPSKPRPGAFFLRGMTVGGALWLSEQVGIAILDGAKQAGVNLRTFENSTDRHLPRGAIVYMENGRHFL